MKRTFWILIGCLALAFSGCAQSEDSSKQSVELPGELAEDNGKGDWRTRWYTDVREDLYFNDTIHDDYSPAWPNYYNAHELDLAAGDDVNLRVGQDDGFFDPVIGLYGPQQPDGEWGALIAVNDDTPEGGSFDSWIKFQATETGKYLLIVREYDWYPGEYWASLTCNGGPCEASQCAEVLCELYCPYGFERDENGCEICSCQPPPACPEATGEGTEICAQVITYGKNPDTGECCQYPTPCQVPDHWETFSNAQACEGPAAEGEDCSLHGRSCAEGLECDYQCPDGSNDPDCNLGINPQGVCVPVSTAECQTDSDCAPTGCSGQVCSAEPVATTCEWRPEYACYQQYGNCGCNNGQCGWADTTSLNQCLDNN